MLELELEVIELVVDTDVVGDTLVLKLNEVVADTSVVGEPLELEDILIL